MVRCGSKVRSGLGFGSIFAHITLYVVVLYVYKIFITMQYNNLNYLSINIYVLMKLRIKSLSATFENRFYHTSS